MEQSLYASKEIPLVPVMTLQFTMISDRNHFPIQLPHYRIQFPALLNVAVQMDGLLGEIWDI